MKIFIRLLGGHLGFIGDQNKATYGIIAAGWYPQIAYCMIIYLAGLTAIEPEQIEAARLDGAKGLEITQSSYTTSALACHVYCSCRHNDRRITLI